MTHIKPFDDGSRDPVFQRYYARVLLAQARVFRLRGQKDGWLHSLINWAGEARRKSVQLTPRDLFGPQKTRQSTAGSLRRVATGYH